MVYPRVCGGTRILDGEPAPGTVYPRVCGGTDEIVAGVKRVRGLSPRVRGNRANPRNEANWHWSIPACAGEPRITLTACAAALVYPRVCGGTPSQWDPS